jgi:hypothetical protein
MPKKHGNIPLSRSRAYEAMRRKGFSKAKAARISHAGRTFPQRSRMARKAARTRRRGGASRRGWGR